MVKRIRNDSDKQEIEGIVSMLKYKMDQGTATQEDVDFHQQAIYELVIYDWQTPSYQQAEENHIAQALRKKEERRKLIAPAPSKSLPDTHPDIGGRPPLTRRPGRFAV